MVGSFFVGEASPPFACCCCLAETCFSYLPSLACAFVCEAFVSAPAVAFFGRSPFFFPGSLLWLCFLKRVSRLTPFWACWLKPRCSHLPSLAFGHLWWSLFYFPTSPSLASVVFRGLFPIPRLWPLVHLVKPLLSTTLYAFVC